MLDGNRVINGVEVNAQVLEDALLLINAVKTNSTAAKTDDLEEDELPEDYAEQVVGGGKEGVTSGGEFEGGCFLDRGSLRRSALSAVNANGYRRSQYDRKRHLVKNS